MLPRSDTCVPSHKCLLPLTECDVLLSLCFLTFISFSIFSFSSFSEENLIAALQGDHSKQVILHHRSGCAYIQLSSWAPGLTSKHS